MFNKTTVINIEAVLKFLDKVNELVEKSDSKHNRKVALESAIKLHKPKDDLAFVLDDADLILEWLNQN